MIEEFISRWIVSLTTLNGIHTFYCGEEDYANSVYDQLQMIKAKSDVISKELEDFEETEALIFDYLISSKMRSWDICGSIITEINAEFPLLQRKKLQTLVFKGFRDYNINESLSFKVKWGLTI